MICKQKLAELTKCYCVAGFDDDTGTHILVASEKDYPCYMFSLQGEREETLWETPGGARGNSAGAAVFCVPAPPLSVSFAFLRGIWYTRYWYIVPIFRDG